MDKTPTERVLQAVAAERIEQIEKHGRTREYDLEKNSHWQLRDAAVALIGSSGMKGYPAEWDKATVTKMHHKSYKQRLVIALAMLVAEVERVEAEEAKKQASGK